MNIHETSKLAATRELRAKMQGRVVSWGDDDYAGTRRVWNGAVENQPALFAVCETSGRRAGGDAECTSTRVPLVGARRWT
jgi:hypothetical protein